MSQGAYSVHKEIRKELENYIKTQYFGKTPILFSALKDELSKEGVLYREPYIESLPAYTQVENGFDDADIDNWTKVFLQDLIDADLGVYGTPFTHQKEALEYAAKGRDIFVSTGTGSGKTECFMWPLVVKLTKEARQSQTWEQRGVRAIIMYPMNALVSDQLSRLRNIIGDPDGNFIKAFRNCAGNDKRRPQFGMYTGRTPYPGIAPQKVKDNNLAETYGKLIKPNEENEQEIEYYNNLLKEGRIPAKNDLEAYVERLRNGNHVPDKDDAELLTRFEMQHFSPDILITNYSMMEYMLLRPREAKIWADTKEWLELDQSNKLLFIIDEAHMYRGSSGGEVALLIRRLLHKLDIGVDRVQFILTTASMPNKKEEDKKAVRQFAYDLTGKAGFKYLFGDPEKLDQTGSKELGYVDPSPELLEGLSGSEKVFDCLNYYWSKAATESILFKDFEHAREWMYDHITEYRQFSELISACRGSAISISDLAKKIYPDKESEEGANAISLLISIAQLAKNKKGSVLFPAKMHLLFRGIKGVFACSNPGCTHSHSNDGVKLGNIMINDQNFVCPDCGSVVYELYQDRRCGALFFKGYVAERDMENGKAYLWHYSGQLLDETMVELHFFIPPEGYVKGLGRGAKNIKPCYLNTRNGFIDFIDDTHSNDPIYRKLYYSLNRSDELPDLMTFSTCPHCQKSMSASRLSSFATRGNQSFNNLVKAQFNSEDPVPNRLKDPTKYPNEGRKVLLFSDSRQRAANLARDMTQEAEKAATRQLYMCALNTMMEKEQEISLDESYGYFLNEAIRHNVSIFDSKFTEDCSKLRKEAARNERRSSKRKREIDLSHYTISSNSHPDFQEQVMRLYCDNYNTLDQDALSWIEPMDYVLDCIIDDVAEELNIDIDNDDNYDELHSRTIEIFSAWFIDVCDANQAMGPTIGNAVRSRVRRNYKEGFGLKAGWSFSSVIKKTMLWEDGSDEMKAFQNAFQTHLLERSINASDDSYYVKLDTIKPIYEENHKWFKCKRCSEVSPFLLNNKCPSCGADEIKQMDKEDYDALAFWRDPAEEAMQGKPIRVIDTEEHTAQLSHKDQQYDMWSKTEQYEMRFQDMVKGTETPVDILSSTTTMEVGIDIGSLVAVGLRNIPPTRENYQQRAGRAGRRGSSLSTIVTFCENGPYDTLYFNDPVPMLRGEPRSPWIDVDSKKLLQRHLNMLVFQDYIKEKYAIGMDELLTKTFVDELKDKQFENYINSYVVKDARMLLGEVNAYVLDDFKSDLIANVGRLKEKCNSHPELYVESELRKGKSILDALYEEGIIPTYSFPKDVVSFYINNYSGQRTKIDYQVERGLDIAIGEYAPGRTVVVDKKTFQIGGLYYPGTEIRNPTSPISGFINDPNYNKKVISCEECGWFDIEREPIEECPFCGNNKLRMELPMLRPWGFAPKNARAYSDAEIDEEYSFAKEPLYSTLPKAEEMKRVSSFRNIRKASRGDQSIIMLNKGPSDKGFSLCRDCGAIMPAEKANALMNVNRPYKVKGNTGRCSHNDITEVNLGYELKTDMLVLEFRLDNAIINTRTHNNLWLTRAATSLAEALRLVAGKKMDIEFSELITGHRIRSGNENTYIDIYIYDSLSSGAGYSEHLSDVIEELLLDTLEYLKGCDCESACYSCLKHYRNQHKHARLDRNAAIDLLKWGINGDLPEALSVYMQSQLLHPIESILEEYGIEIIDKGNDMLLRHNALTKNVEVFPAMLRCEEGKRKIYVSDYMLKYAKPTAVERIVKEM